MQSPYVFDSICSRKPRGAVKEGEKVAIDARLLRTKFHCASLLVQYEAQGRTTSVPMQWVNLENGYDCYSGTIETKGAVGLIWCTLQAEDYDGNTVSLGETFQITVYQAEYETPEWYAQGVTYHAFVDRFFRCGALPKTDPDYVLHQSWDETPVYLPDENGIVQNKDIYGGNLRGIIEKLPYLDSLGVRTIYLSPIFEAWSNHKYNTADYRKVDPHFGTKEDLADLCACAKEYGMRVILDGVFSHTGSDSVYFNQKGRYDAVGAAQSKDSPYRDWYTFHENGYDSWWGIDTLPAVKELTPSYLDFVIEAEDSVIAQWMKCGISGWRLDVADELPDEFIARLRRRVKELDSSALVIGEVWEDASNKVAYDKRRPYFTEQELDGVMNYPLKDGILAFLNGHISGTALGENLCLLLDHYPKQSQRCLMNLIGTHDTPRALTVLGAPQYLYTDKAFKAQYRMSTDERKVAIERLKLAACLQYVFPGSPSLYYGDEVGMEGFEDPLNRRCYPWGNEDKKLLSFYQKLGKIKCKEKDLHTGEFSVWESGEDFVVIRRGDVFCAVNRGEEKQVQLPKGTYRDLMRKASASACVALPRNGYFWYKKVKERIGKAGKR